MKIILQELLPLEVGLSLSGVAPLSIFGDGLGKMAPFFLFLGVHGQTT